MLGCLRSCVGKLALLVVLLAAGVFAWFEWGPEVPPVVVAWFHGEEKVREPTPEMAEATLDRFEAFRAGEGGQRMSLGPLQLSSVIRYALPGILPAGVQEPSVDMSDGKIYLSARVATAAFPELPSLEEVVGLLPDTVAIQMRGSLLPFDDAHAALHVDRIQAMKIPLPDRFTPEILAALGRQDRQGLPPDAMMIPLPTGLKSTYILRDSLVLVREES